MILTLLVHIFSVKTLLCPFVEYFLVKCFVIYNHPLLLSVAQKDGNNMICMYIHVPRFVL